MDDRLGHRALLAVQKLVPLPGCPPCKTLYSTRVNAAKLVLPGLLPHLTDKLVRK